MGPSDDARRDAQNYVPEYPSAGDIVTPGSGVTPISDELKFSRDEIGKLQDGKLAIYVIGGVRYRDLFDPKIPPYETTYCYKMLLAGMPFGNCDFKPPAFHASIK